MQRAKRARVFITWEPVWEDTFSSWAISTIRKQRWRCDIIEDEEDLLQDAHLLFLKLAARYPRVIEARHFMALFKTALNNHIHDKSRYLQRKHACHVELPMDTSELCIGHIGDTTNAGYMAALLAEAPEELKLALALLTEEPHRLEALITPKEPRENLNMKLRRILGLADTFDLRQAVTDLLFN
jgi:hypothetical protein